MADNVLILGAGFSFDAGIPLMGSFVERMWEIARRKKEPLEGKPLLQEDQKLLDEAIRLMNELDVYHGRANFDDRNIEDLLSILSFRALAGGKGSRSSLETLTQAIARTIEMTCSVKDRNLISRPNSAISSASDLYKSFWRALFNMYGRTGTMPAIVTFNYDLVLERSLLELLVGTEFNPYQDGKRCPVSSFRVNYFNKLYACQALKAKPADYPTSSREHRLQSGYKLEVAPDATPNLDITLLKLHGSLNFSKSGKDAPTNLETAAVDPQILPPLFNKDTAALGSSIWAQALKELSQAKNIVVVGYSLPRTDIYMQYFLRAGLGPNTDLNKITVYDPTLFASGNAGNELKLRYQECFSPQLQRRINFNPENSSERIGSGTTKHFISHLGKNVGELLFI